jgi:hypothetical protein
MAGANGSAEQIRVDCNTSRSPNLVYFGTTQDIDAAKWFMFVELPAEAYLRDSRDLRYHFLFPGDSGTLGIPQLYWSPPDASTRYVWGGGGFDPSTGLLPSSPSSGTVDITRSVDNGVAVISGRMAMTLGAPDPSLPAIQGAHLATGPVRVTATWTNCFVP